MGDSNERKQWKGLISQKRLDALSFAAFHFLQVSFWRFLADTKIYEVDDFMPQNHRTPTQAIDQVTGIRITVLPADKNSG